MQQQPPYPGQQPPYGYGMPPQQQAPTKKRNTTLIVLGAAGAALLAVCLLCGLIVALASHGAGATTTNGTGGTSTTQQQQHGGPAKVGDTITVDGVGCTLVSAAIYHSGNQFITPKAGNEFVKVVVKLHNGSSSEVDYSEFDFHAKSSAGNITTLEITTNNNDLGTGKLAAGGTTQGGIVFQIPTGDHGAQLTWQPSIFGNTDTNAWALGV